MKMKTLNQRRQSAPSLVISKAFTKSRNHSREQCLSPVSPEMCPLVQSFLTPARTFLTHGHAQLKTGLQTQERYLFLFSDILLITKAKSSTHFKLKAQVRVCDMWTAGCMEEVCEGSTSPDRSFVMGWPTFNCVATFSSVEQKEKWFSFIKSQIKEEKEKDDPETIPLKIFAKDIGNCAYAKTLTVSHTDCATQVIAMALQQFGISGCVKDYQLWVSSKKDDPPYPLIGHEFPFSIKMSHIRDHGLQNGGGKETVTPPDLQGMLLLERLPLNTQCQFILKPSRVAVEQPVLDGGQKPFRRKRSIMAWAFWRGSSSQLDGLPASPTLPTSPTSPTSKQLFGLPLSAVCKGDALPKSIMDMLALLYQEGPFTRGIFRRSASVKACREVRDRLNSGDEDVTLTCESTFVTGAVFKDFLRHIPGSLLSQDLYEQWVEVMEQAGEEEEERVQAVQRLVQLLPPENQLLLGHLLAVLHCIHRHSHHNQMNSFNLSVCIAPSMLWAPNPCSPSMESEGTKKVSEVVRFLIEHCCEVLGEDIASLFGRFPERASSREHGSDVSSFQLNDSSYDSLENELNEDGGSPLQSLRLHKGKQENRSRDSVLTLSDDCDLDSSCLELPPLARPRKFTSATQQPPPRALRDGPAPEPDAPPPRWQRRCSEPALSLPLSSHAPSSASHLPVSRKSSYDAVTNCNVFGEERDLSRGGGAGEVSRGVPPPPLCRKPKHPSSALRLDTSLSSLSSPATSPSGSSMSSLDSAFSQGSADYTIHHAPRTQGHPLCSPTSGSAPSSESPNWSQHRGTHGFHPNTRELLLFPQQQDKDGGREGEEGEEVEEEEEEEGQRDPGGLAGDLPRRRSCSPPSYQQVALKVQRYRSPCYRVRDRGLMAREGRSPHATPPCAVFYGQATSSLSLQKEQPQPPVPPAPPTPLTDGPRRRASEPSVLRLGKPSTTHLNTRRGSLMATACAGQDLQNSGLKVSDVEPHRNPEPRFCLSPSTTRALRDYFFTATATDTGDTLKRSQEVASALVQGKREWQARRCSDPRFDDFEQMLFGEESYV
ncbi:rho GTPase-activating protein 20 isoform X2 [Anguilla anguilla]|uniref:rho GTPase-activating protein 20 isoform X2 n=1 Tax=Anguilla anguilla TaxID=7936 RepID=UPI0015B1276F|nr:rho GTPase-activating protein 20 isoform X2 [Anguilla anguilla]